MRAGILSDLGGEAYASVAQQELAQRAAILGSMCEDQQARWLRGDDLDLGSYCTVVNAQRRVLADLGLERMARSINTDIHRTIRKVKRSQS